MPVKIVNDSPGLHPREVVVGPKTAEGVERLVDDRRSIVSNSLDIGYPISYEKNDYLIELLRETQSGA